MAHMLDETKGFPAFAYFGEPGWHGLGQEIKADERTNKGVWLAKGGLDFEVNKLQAGHLINGEFQAAANRIHLVRSDTLATIGAHTDGYKPVQPIDVLDFFDRFIAADDRFNLETVGALRGGRVIWALARFQENLSIGGDETRMYAMLATSFDGSMATTAQGTATRVVCNNTMQASLMDKRAVIRVKHNADFSGFVADRAARDLAEICGQFEQFKAMGEALAQNNINRDAITDLFKRLADIPLDANTNDKKQVSTRKANILEALEQSYRETIEEGTPRLTQWAAFNAVTRYVDHERSTRDTDDQGEFASRMFAANFGAGAGLKSRALELLTAS